MFTEAGAPHKSVPKPFDLENPDPKPLLSEERGENPRRTRASNSQELSLSYLCDNPALDPPEEEASGKNLLGSLEKSRCKVEEIVVSEPPATAVEGRRWIERDFLRLKRELPEGVDWADSGSPGKKAKIETLSLALCPPNLSLSLGSPEPFPSAAAAAAFAIAAAAPGPPPPPVPPKRAQSSYTHNTRASSNDFVASHSYSYYSLPFSHNGSCSLACNSTENYEYSKDDDHIWHAGEGTNGSVHSKFRPVGDADTNNMSFSNQSGHPRLMNNSKEVNNSLFAANYSENCSVFPSELPARQREGNALVISDAGRHIGHSRPDRILREIVSESVPVVSQMLQELPSDSMEGIKEYLRNLLNTPEKREEFSSLKRRLKRRSDLTFETLLKSHQMLLDILVTVKTGLGNFLSGENRLPTTELVEIFMLSRCRNVNCRSVLPVDDCDCKICSNKKGFCSACMCPICLNFDCASNTCSWVGCDVCSHWCHAVCSLQKNRIRPGPCSGGSVGTIEMQFYCPGCGHASEMFGFVKEVFTCCAEDWGLVTLMKELDCVRKIFHGSEDIRGKELWSKAGEILDMLGKKLISPMDACNSVLQFLKYGISELSGSAGAFKDRETAQTHPLPPAVTTHTYELNSSNARRDELKDINKIDLKAIEPEPPLPKQDEFGILGSVVRLKEAEAKLYQRLADDARREMEGYRQIAHAKSEKLDEEHATELARLCLQDIKEQRRKKLEELKMLENSHRDYYNLKIRMQAEIASLLGRVEATRQQWV